MKKISYIVLGGMLVFAACQPNNTQDAAKLQHTIDSTAAELAKPEIEKLQKACDDEIMAAAMDSAKVIMAHAKKGVVHHAVAKPIVKKITDVKPTVTSRPGASNQTQGTTTNRPGASNNPNTASGTVNTVKKRPGAN
jgi:hypothetical protein